MSETLLQMTGIGKSFSGQRVLDNVSFELRAGETHVLAGENGAGKSTLMRIASGVYTDYEGVMRLRGEEMRFHSPQDAVRRGVSIIHQELSLIPSMCISDNLFLGREGGGRAGLLNFQAERRACAALLERLGIEASPETLVEDLPIGVRQSVEIAKALAFDASVIVMDEPTSALTAPEAERLFFIIEELKRQGRGIVYISHKMEEIYRLADRITVLRDGGYVGVEQAGRLPREALIQWMVGRSVEEFACRDAPPPGEVALDVRHLSLPDVGGRPRPVLDDISFQVRRGEIVGLAGLQGSGAETLLNCLYGTLGSGVKGEVLLEGRVYAPRSPGYALKRGMALLSSDRKREGLVLSMSIVHNITLAALPRISPGGWLQERRELRVAEARRRLFGIRAASLSLTAGVLSGGNQQKVALAKCLEVAPRVLLLNEPTRGVDVSAKQEIYALMNQWTRDGIAIVLITSEMPELIALSDRILALHRGRIMNEFQRSSAVPEAILAAAMGNNKE